MFTETPFAIVSHSLFTINKPFCLRPAFRAFFTAYTFHCLTYTWRYHFIFPFLRFNLLELYISYISIILYYTTVKYVKGKMNDMLCITYFLNSIAVSNRASTLANGNPGSISIYSHDPPLAVSNISTSL